MNSEVIGEGTYRQCYSTDNPNLCVKKLKSNIIKQYFGFKFDFGMVKYLKFKFGFSDINMIEYQQITKLPKELKEFIPSDIELTEKGLIMERPKDYTDEYSLNMISFGKVRNEHFWSCVDEICAIFDERKLWYQDIFFKGNNILVKKVSKDKFVPIIIDFTACGSSNTTKGASTGAVVGGLVGGWEGMATGALIGGGVGLMADSAEDKKIQQQQKERELAMLEKTIFRGKEVFNRVEEISKLEVIDVRITNTKLDNPIDAAELNLLLEDELSSHSCVIHTLEVEPGARMASDEINQAFATLKEKEYRFLVPARTVLWKVDDTTYWIQWTVKDETKVLWAYDPELKKVVEVLQVKDKDHQH